MPDSVVLTLFYVALIAWAARAEYRRAKERRMEKQLEVMFEEDPVVIEAAPAGRRFEQRGLDEDARDGGWMPLDEVVALRILACSFFDTPRVIREMETGKTFRTRLFEYRLVQ